MIQIWPVTLPETFNAATYFVDRNVAEGRGGKVAIECGDQRVTYAEVAENVNRFANALRRLGVEPEQRVALLLLDSPAFAYSFFGAIKAGAVPVPLNTLWRGRDYQYALNDSGARVLVISAALLGEFSAIDRAALRRLAHVIVVRSADLSAEARSAKVEAPRAEADRTLLNFDTLLAES